MSLVATTQHPDEVRKHFNDYADVLDIYASDQIAALRWQKTAKSKREVEIRSEVYADIARELRSIKFMEPSNA